LLPLRDPAKETERNRLSLDPDQLRVEKDARAKGLEVLGYYHSHPDHPARPSIYDREHAWPWYSYVIVSAERGSAKDLTCWVLAEDEGSFCLEPVEVVEQDGCGFGLLQESPSILRHQIKWGFGVMSIFVSDPRSGNGS
jgi:proteasome lid subunit RPN8/RPN11